MSRKEEMIEELELAIETVKKWSLEKLNNYSSEDLDKESHLLGIDIIHDCCHTLRGKLPKTEKVTLTAMKNSWSK